MKDDLPHAWGQLLSARFLAPLSGGGWGSLKHSHFAPPTSAPCPFQSRPRGCQTTRGKQLPPGLTGRAARPGLHQGHLRQVGDRQSWVQGSSSMTGHLTLCCPLPEPPWDNPCRAVRAGRRQHMWAWALGRHRAVSTCRAERAGTTGRSSIEADHRRSPVSGCRSCCFETPGFGCPGLGPLALPLATFAS